MIYAKSKEKNTLFFEELNYYVDLIRGVHKKTYELISKQKAGSNPLMFCEGGFYGGNLESDDIVKDIVKENFTASFGITALNELVMLATGKPLTENLDFALRTVKAIQSRVDYWRQVDGYDYSLYGTPAESLCKTQVMQFRKKYGIIEGVSDRDFFTNSFHMHVSENITPMKKQDLEAELFHMHTGGHIQYVKIANSQNYSATKALIERGIYRNGFYQGVNVNSCTCEECGHNWNGKINDSCPECKSDKITELNRICGYLGSSRKKGDWSLNDGKIEEIKARISM